MLAVRSYAFRDFGIGFEALVKSDPRQGGCRVEAQRFGPVASLLSSRHIGYRYLQMKPSAAMMLMGSTMGCCSCDGIDRSGLCFAVLLAISCSVLWLAIIGTC